MKAKLFFLLPLLIALGGCAIAGIKGPLNLIVDRDIEAAIENADTMGLKDCGDQLRALRTHNSLPVSGVISAYVHGVTFPGLERCLIRTTAMPGSPLTPAPAIIGAPLPAK